MKKEEYALLSKAEKKKVKFNDLPKANKRGAIITILIVFVVFPFLCSKMFNSSPSTTNLEGLTAQQKDSVKRIELIQSQFSGFDGSQRNLVKYVKENMNDPESFEHVETRYWDFKKKIVVQMTYRGKNAFGALMKETIIADTDIDGTVMSVKKVE